MEEGPSAAQSLAPQPRSPAAGRTPGRAAAAAERPDPRRVPLGGCRQPGSVTAARGGPLGTCCSGRAGGEAVRGRGGGRPRSPTGRRGQGPSSPLYGPGSRERGHHA